MDDNLYIYNCIDAACTFEIRDAIWDELDADGFRSAYDMTIRLYEPLMFMMTRGIKVDRVALEETKKQIIQARDTAQEELNKLAGRELNANSPKQIQAYFYIEKGIEPYKGKYGTVTADDKALQRIARGTAKRKGLREAKLIQDIRGYGKLYGSYMDIAFDADDRLRGAYNPRGSKFGRLSSGKTVFDTGCNLQAMPQEFKAFLVPDDGYFFIEFDKRQAEWVVVAYVSGDARMLHVIETKRDPHSYTGALMLYEQLPSDIRRSVSIEQLEEIVKAENKLIGMLTDEDEIRMRRNGDKLIRTLASSMPRTMSTRQAGKKSNHGLNYDETYRMFALINEIPEHEAAKIVNLYHKGYPGVRTNFHGWIKQQLTKNNRILENCFGRRMRFLDQWGPDLWKSAYASIPQSTVVDGLNQGLCEIYEDAGIVVKSNVDLLAQTHDSILTQFPLKLLNEKRAWPVIQKIYKYLEPKMEYNGRAFIIATDMKMGWNWGQHHPDRNPTGMHELPECSNERAFYAAAETALGS